MCAENLPHLLAVKLPRFVRWLAQGAQTLMGDNLEVVLAEFSTLSLAVFIWAGLHDIYKHAHI